MSDKKESNPPCPLCGTWKCLDCGATRYRANRFYPKKHACPKCDSFNGEMLPLRHQDRRYRDEQEELRFLAGKEVYYPLEGHDYA